jgi:hypothetical protein
LDYNKKKDDVKIKIAEMKFMSNVAGYTRKDQIRNIKMREELNILRVHAIA